MTIRSITLTKAIPALVLGIAFFLSGCQPRVPVEEEIAEEAPVDHFALGEGYLQSSELDKALNAYRTYLEQFPRDKNSALALHRMAAIYSQTEKYAEAVDLLKRIAQEFPYYPDLPIVRYEIADRLFLLGEYQGSIDESVVWIEKYPWHALKGSVFLLLGENSKALGDHSTAFDWWLKAEAAWMGDLQKQAEISEKLEKLISVSAVEELEQMSGIAVGTDYLPKIYHRLATTYLEENELEKAQTVAMALVRSTPEQYWVSAGKQILESIQEELSVRKNAVGCLLPLTGPFAIYGEEVLKGIELGMGMFTETVESPNIELVIKDTAGDPERAVAEIEDLVHNEKVIAIIGPLSSKTAEPAARKAQTLATPIIALTQREGITEVGTMVFRNFMTPSREVNRLLDTAVSEMDLKRFAILYPDNPYGQFFLNLFWDRLQEIGGVVTAVESYHPEETDFAEQIKKITGLFYPRPKSLERKLRDMRTPEEEESIIFPEEPQTVIDFDAVFIPDNFQRVAMIAPQLAYHDVLGVRLMGTNLWQSHQLVELAGDYVQGAIFPSGFFEDLGNPRVKSFVEEYEANFNTPPGILAATGHDTIKLLKALISEQSVRTRRDLQEALFDSYPFEGVTGNLSFDPHGEVENQPLLLTISGRGMKLLQ